MTTETQREQQERREVLRNDQRLREQGTTLHQFAQADVEIPRDRFAQVNAATVIGAKPSVAAAYPAASAAHQVELPPEPPLGFDNPALEPSAVPHSVEATGDPMRQGSPQTPVQPDPIRQ